MLSADLRPTIKRLLAETEKGDLNPIYREFGTTLDVAFCQDVYAAINSGIIWWTAYEPTIRQAVCSSSVFRHIATRDEVKSALDIADKILKLLKELGVNVAPMSLPLLAAQTGVLVLRLGSGWCEENGGTNTATKNRGKRKKKKKRTARK